MTSSEYDTKSIAEVVHDFAVVRGDLTEQYARDQLVRVFEARLDRAQAAGDGVDLLIAQAERRGAVKALNHAAGMFAQGLKDDPHLEIKYLRKYAEEIENGRAL